jgi:uncharacterized protein
MFGTGFEPIYLYSLFILIFIISGIVKGITGIGLPMTSLAILTTFISPLQAIGLNVIPVIMANILQFSTAKSPRFIAKKYKIFALFMFLGVSCTSFLTASLSDQTLKLLIGCMVIIFALDNLFRKSWTFDIRNDKYWQIFMGSISGIIGGLTSIWGVPIIMYLILRKADKEEFVDTTGFLFLVAVIPATVGYISTGILITETIPLAIVCGMAALIGMRIGREIRKRIVAETFKRLLLLLFIAIGVKLIWNAFIGM